MDAWVHWESWKGWQENNFCISISECILVWAEIELEYLSSCWCFHKLSRRQADYSSTVWIDLRSLSWQFSSYLSMCQDISHVIWNIWDSVWDSHLRLPCPLWATIGIELECYILGNQSALRKLRVPVKTLQVLKGTVKGTLVWEH